MILINRDKLLTILNEHRALYCDNTPESFKKLDHSDKCRVDEIDSCIATIFNLSTVDFKAELEEIKAEVDDLKCYGDQDEFRDKVFELLDKKIKELNNDNP